MVKVKEEIKEKAYYKDIYFLYESFSALKTIDELKNFIKDILTKSELRMLKRRWHIANLLMDGLDIRSVAQKSRSGTQTVIKIKQILEDGRGGLVLALERARVAMEKETRQRKSQKIRGGSKFVKNWFR